MNDTSLPANIEGDAQAIAKRYGAKRYGANRQAAIWASAAFLALGGAVVALSSWALDPSRRLHFLRSSAVEYITREEWREAALQLGNIVQVAPNDADAWRELGLVQLREAAGDDGERYLQDAVRSLRKAADLAPDDPRPRRWLLEVELRSGNSMQAYEHALKLAQLDPKHPLLTTAWDALPSLESTIAADLEAAMTTRQGTEQTAETCRKRFAAQPVLCDPEFARVFVEALTKLQRYAERDRFLSDLDARYPSSKRLQCLRAECALLDGDVGGAVAIASHSLEGPTAATARAICAEAHLRWAAAEPSESLHHFGRAFEHLKTLAELSPNDESTIAKLALVEGERLGRLDDALKTTREALSKTEKPSSDLSEAHGRLLTAAGRSSEAMPFLESAAAAQPSGRTWTSFLRGLSASQTAKRINNAGDGSTVARSSNGY
jgi:tetratricopeptide (TPR) repeat protein